MYFLLKYNNSRFVVKHLKNLLFQKFCATNFNLQILVQNKFFQTEINLLIDKIVKNKNLKWKMLQKWKQKFYIYIFLKNGIFFK